MKRTKQKVSRRVTLAEVCDALEAVAPLKLAQKWDNVGLLAGDREAVVRRILLTIDLTETVVNEAIDEKADLVVAYHPPIFKPIRSLIRPGAAMESLVWRCIRSGIAIYSPHTALDAAEGGTNDCLARICGVEKCEPLVTIDDPSRNECKIVVFVPREAVDAVAEAMFRAGAGRIGDYDHCSFRAAGEGTFLGGKSTHPQVGIRGRLERVTETRLETIVRSGEISAVIAAMRSAHPYEEPAFDIYPLRGRPLRGIGRIGSLEKKLPLNDLARKLKRATKAMNVQLVGSPERLVERAIIVAGSAGSLPFKTQLTPSDVIITGEIRHHDALQIQRHGNTAIALGHWASERPVLEAVREALSKLVSGIHVVISAGDCDPLVSL